jgi:hypothetical protein
LATHCGDTAAKKIKVFCFFFFKKEVLAYVSPIAGRRNNPTTDD